MVFPTLAADAEVYAEPVQASDEMVSVPIQIRGNTGLMGFKLIVNYDSAVLQPQTVSRGTVTQSGMMNDSIGAGKSGNLLIVWSDTDAVKADGTLAVLTLKAIKQTDTTLNIAYSQEDTFDGEYEDVALDCKPIDIRIGGEASTTDLPVKKTPDSRDIAAAVESVENPTDVSAVNEAIARLTGTEDMYKTPQEIQSAYIAATADNFVQTALLTVDGEKIDAAIIEALQEVGAETVDAVPLDKQEAFVRSVETALREAAPDIPIISDKLPADEALRVIETLRVQNEEAVTSGVKIQNQIAESSSKHIGLMIAIAAILTAAAISAMWILIRIKKKRNHEKQEEL